MLNAIIGAGGAITADDPLAEIGTVGQPKALLQIGGKRMVDWVLDAVAASEKVNQILIVGLTEDHNLNSHGKPMHFLPDMGGLFSNANNATAESGKLNPDQEQVVWVSADIPMISTDMLDWVIDQCTDEQYELYYTLIEKPVMEARFPNSRRTFTKLKNREVCGGDINVFDVKVANGLHPAISKITAARKSVLKQARLAGIWPAILLLTRQMTTERGELEIHKRLELKTKFVICPHAEVGMDVDKPYQYDIARDTLAPTT